MNSGSCKSINVYMVESWFLLSRKYLGIGLCILTHDVEFYFRPRTNFINV